MSIIFPEKPKILQRKLDDLQQKLKQQDLIIERLEAEQDLHNKYAGLFREFKTKYLERFKVRTALELAVLPNDAESAPRRDRLAGRIEAYNELQQFEDGVEERLTNALVAKGKLLSDIATNKEMLKKQTEREERKVLNA